MSELSQAEALLSTCGRLWRRRLHRPSERSDRRSSGWAAITREKVSGSTWPAATKVETLLLQIGFAVCGLESNTPMADLNRSVPLGRAVRPEDIADGVLLLASEAARYMCGALVEVNGGKAVE